MIISGSLKNGISVFRSYRKTTFQDHGRSPVPHYGKCPVHNYRKSPCHLHKKELPGLNNLYMIGQWVEPGGGLPNTIRSARYVAQIICKKDNKEFEVKK